MQKFITWRITRDGEQSAEIRHSKRSAVIQYNKDSARSDLKENGWSVSEDAEPWARRMVGLKAFLDLGERD